MKKLKPYIRIFTEINHTVLQVDTCELRDYVEDYLTEVCNIEYEYIQELNLELKHLNRESYNLFYSDKYPLSLIETAISSLDETRIKEIVEYQWIQADGKFYCPCCGYNTFIEPPTGTYIICIICFWEDDPIQLENPNYQGGANRVSLIQGQKNFEMFGACEKEMINNVTKPTEEDIRNPSWKRY